MGDLWLWTHSHVRVKTMMKTDVHESKEGVENMVKGRWSLLRCLLHSIHPSLHPTQLLVAATTTLAPYA